MDKVLVKSTVNGAVTIDLPELRFNRTWAQRGSKIMVDKQILQEALYDLGTEYLFKTGILYIDDLDVKKELGLEPEDAEKPQNIIVYDEKEMNRLLTTAQNWELEEALKKVSHEQVQAFVDYAVEHEIPDINKCGILEKISGVNVLQAIMFHKEEK